MSNTDAEKNPPKYQFADFSLDRERGSLSRAGQEIKLRPKVFDALQYLVENRGRLVPKEELIQALWPDAFVTDDSLVQCMVELRRALDDRQQEIVKTVPRRGYVFAAAVTMGGDAVTGAGPDSAGAREETALAVPGGDPKPVVAKRVPGRYHF